MNYDVWNWTVGYLVDDLRIDKEFPLYPDVSRDDSRNMFMATWA